MPIYEYTCGSCHREFELLVRSAKEAKGLKCPHCQSTTIERKVSAFAAHQGPSRSAGSSSGSCDQCCYGDGSCSI
jgi:putative FmdB family regulatory protein